ncbi:MAG: hypothetical protein R3E10_02990 [Gemmatimonadota bacterium]
MPSSVRHLARFVGLFLGLGLVRPAPAAGQNGCEIVSSDYWQALRQGTPTETHIFRRVSVACEDGLRIYADSAVILPPQNLSRLFGRVRFDEGVRLLTADRADYYSADERLLAWGSVVLADAGQGSRMEGAEMVYLRQTSARPRQRITMTGTNVRATLYPRQASRRTAEAAPPSPPPPDSAGAEAVSTIRVPAGPGPEVPRAFRFHWLWEQVIALLADVLPRRVPESVMAAVPDSAAVPAAVPTPTEAPEPSVQPTTAPPDTTRPPYHVTAHRRIVIDGESAFEAEGQVEIEREGLHAFGERLRYDDEWGQLHLLGAARSEGEGYQLTADAIALMLVEQEVEEVIARDRAQLSTDDIDLNAPRIRVFVEDSTVNRLAAGLLGANDTVPVIGSGGGQGAVSWVQLTPTPGDSTRPVAVAEEFRLEADSLDVLTPGEQLDRVTAIGRARGDSFTRDSLNTAETPALIRNDWLEGDTIIATFVKDSTAVAEGDTLQTAEGGGYTLERLDARGAARSLYRMEPSDSTRVGEARLALHYVVGNAITIVMVDGDVDHMEVQGQTKGIHLEPLAPVPDSLADSTAVRPDTARVGQEQPPGPPRPGAPDRESGAPWAGQGSRREPRARNTR